MLVTIADIAWDDPGSPQVLRMHLKQSKTDQLRKGVDIFVGSTGNDLSPVVAMLVYLSVRDGGPWPLFRFTDRRCLSRDRFVTHVPLWASWASIVPHMQGRASRIEAATTANERGIADSLIQALGCWKSDAFQAPERDLSSLFSPLVTLTLSHCMYMYTYRAGMSTSKCLF